MNHYIDLNIMDTHSNYCDVKSLKIKRIQNKIKSSLIMNPFAKNSNAHQTDVKQAQLKVDLIGLWHLKEINGQDKQSEKIFYNINCTEIKVLPYGDYKKYNNYNYILRNSNVYFGNGPYTVTIKNNEMTFSSLHFDCSITFKKVTVDQIQSILSKKNLSSESISHSLRFFDDYSIKDIIPRYKWQTYAYMYGNDSISYDLKKIEYQFNEDMSFCMTNESGSHYGTFDIKNRQLILTYDDGFEQKHTTVFVEFNRKFEHYYLYVSEDCDKYEGCYTVYVNS